MLLIKALCGRYELIVITIIVLGLSTIAVIGLSLEPMSRLESEQPDEFKRIGGAHAAILGWRWLFFSVYLAAGDFKKNIESAITVRKFRPAMWAARIQIVSLVVLLGYWLGT